MKRTVGMLAALLSWTFVGALSGPALEAGTIQWSYDFYDGNNAAWTGGQSPATGGDNWIAPSSGYAGGGTKWPYLATPPTGDAIMWRRSTVPTTEWSVMGSLVTGTQGSQIYTTVMMNWAPHTRQNNAAFSYQIPASATWFELEFYGQPGPGTGASFSNADPNNVAPDPSPTNGYAGYGSTNIFGLTNAAGAVEVYFGATQGFWSSNIVLNTMSAAGNWSNLNDRTHLSTGLAGSDALTGYHTYKLHVALDGPTYGASGTGTMYVDGIADPALTGKNMGLTSHPSTWTGLFFMVISQPSLVDDFVIRSESPPHLTANPVSGETIDLDVGSVVAGSIKTLYSAVRLTSDGDAGTTVQLQGATGFEGTAFSIPVGGGDTTALLTSGLPGSLQAFDLQFNSAGLLPGSYTATVTFNNDSPQGPVTYNLRANVVLIPEPAGPGLIGFVLLALNRRKRG